MCEHRNATVWMVRDTQGTAGKDTKCIEKSTEAGLLGRSSKRTLMCGCNFKKMRVNPDLLIKFQVCQSPNRKPPFYLSDTTNTDAAQSLPRSL